MEFLTARKIIKSHLASSAPIAIGILVAKYCRQEIITISIQLVLDAQNVVIHLVMERKCICKAVPYGILDVDQVIFSIIENFGFEPIFLSN